MTLSYCDAQKIAVLDGGAVLRMHLSESQLLIILLMFEVDDLSVPQVMEDIALIHTSTHADTVMRHEKKYIYRTTRVDESQTAIVFQ